MVALVKVEPPCRRLYEPAGCRCGVSHASLLANPGVQAIYIPPEAPLEVWDVVTTIIKRLT